MKKIAYILTTYHCPSETFAQREIKQLRRQGYEVNVFAADVKSTQLASEPQIPTYYRPAFFSFDAIWSVVCVCIRHPVWILNIVVLFVKLLIICPSDALILCGNIHTLCFFARVAKRQEILHIHAYFLSWPACIGIGVSIMTKLPLSIAAHARDIFVESGACQLKVQHAKFITCCNKQGLNYLKEHIGAGYHDKLFLNYHGIELNGHNQDRYCCQKNNLPDLIVAVGRLVKKKGFEHLLEAFGTVLQKRSCAALVIVGDGPQRQYLKSRIERLGIGNNVYLSGWLEHDRTLNLIEQAKVLVVPSIVDGDGDRDGIPNVILEASFVGTPVIASSLPGVSEAVFNEQTGLLVKPGDKNELAVAIERVLTNEVLAAYLTDKAREVLRKKFDIGENCHKLVDLFEKAIL